MRKHTKKRKAQISWAVVENHDTGDRHVVPIRKTRRGALRQIALHRYSLGHMTDNAKCWCKPIRRVRIDGSVLFTHEDLPS